MGGLWKLSEHCQAMVAGLWKLSGLQLYNRIQIIHSTYIDDKIASKLCEINFLRKNLPVGFFAFMSKDLRKNND